MSNFLLVIQLAWVLCLILLLGTQFHIFIKQHQAAHELTDKCTTHLIDIRVQLSSGGGFSLTERPARLELKNKKSHHQLFLQFLPNRNQYRSYINKVSNAQDNFCSLHYQSSLFRGACFFRGACN